MNRWRTALTQRNLRLASGLVLLSYIAAHLINHALGLLSLAAAERGLALAVAIWHSLPGTVLLYGAVAIHVTLALRAIYERRTLRMPPLELLRILLGLGIPLLLIGHVVQTRLAWELHEIAPRYARTVWGLWLSDGEARQLAMLVPGWLHGCLGVHFAFGRRRLYQRLALPLFGLALLVPVLGGLGFLAMAKELASDDTLRPRLDALAAMAPAARESLLGWRETVLAIYLGAIAAIFGARALRGVVERRRGRLLEITYPGRRLRVPRGWSVLEASRSHHLPHLSMCGGRARCTTCRVRISSGLAHCPPPAAAERSALARIGAGSDVRLACQLRPTGDVAVVPLLSPASRTPTPAAWPATVERELVLVEVRWRNQAAFAASHLPQDAVFAAQTLADGASRALEAAGAAIAERRADGVLAVFGLEGTPTQAGIDALAAARGLATMLDALAAQHARAFGSPLDWLVAVHSGRSTVGRFADGGLLVAGSALPALRALQAEAPPALALVVSVAALRRAGETPAEGPVDAFGGVPVQCVRPPEASTVSP